jgi:hypothetical protein
VTDSPSNSPFAGVEVFAASPSGTLNVPRVYTTLDIPGPMRVADLNGDRRGDLVVEHTDWGYVGVMLQRPNGTLAPKRSTRSRIAATSGRMSRVSATSTATASPTLPSMPGAAGVAILYGK